MIQFAEYEFNLKCDLIGALIPASADYVPLVDLRRVFDARVQYYVATVQALVVNQQLVRTAEPIYVMIDTGNKSNK
jgi:hypothetical protein